MILSGRETSCICTLYTNFYGFQYGMIGVQEGSMRCDVNVSVRPSGQQELGTKVEVKNMNSFSAMQKAIDFEIDRQVCVCVCVCCYACCLVTCSS